MSRKATLLKTAVRGISNNSNRELFESFPIVEDTFHISAKKFYFESFFQKSTPLFVQTKLLKAEPDAAKTVYNYAEVANLNELSKNGRTIKEGPFENVPEDLVTKLKFYDGNEVNSKRIQITNKSNIVFELKEPDKAFNDKQKQASANVNAAVPRKNRITNKQVNDIVERFCRQEFKPSLKLNKESLELIKVKESMIYDTLTRLKSKFKTELESRCDGSIIEISPEVQFSRHLLLQKKSLMSKRFLETSLRKYFRSETKVFYDILKGFRLNEYNRRRFEKKYNELINNSIEQLLKKMAQCKRPTLGVDIIWMKSNQVFGKMFWLDLQKRQKWINNRYLNNLTPKLNPKRRKLELGTGNKSHTVGESAGANAGVNAGV